MLTSLKGKSIIVTGGSKGIGRGIAQVFAATGAKVTLASRGEEALKETVDTINAGGGDVRYALCDGSQCEPWWMPRPPHREGWTCCVPMLGSFRRPRL